MFCDCNICKNKVYELRPVDVTRKVTSEMLTIYAKMKRCNEVRNKINYKNVDAVH